MVKPWVFIGLAIAGLAVASNDVNALEILKIPDEIKQFQKLSIQNPFGTNKTESSLVSRDYPTDYYYSISMSPEVIVKTIILFSTYNTNVAAAGQISYPLDYCFPFSGIAAKLTFDAINNDLHYTYFIDVDCTDGILTTSENVGDLSVTSFTVTNTDYKLVSSSSYAPTSTPWFDGDLFDLMYPFNFGLEDEAFPALERFSNNNLPPTGGLKLIAPAFQVRYLQNQFGLIDRYRYNVWSAEHRVLPDHCEKIGNFYYTDVLDPPNANGVVTATEYVCSNDRCAYTVSDVCTRNNIIAINTVGKDFTQMNAAAFIVDTITAVGTTNLYGDTFASVTNYFIDETSPGPLTNYAGEKVEYSFYPSSTVVTASYAVVTPASCGSGTDKYYEVDSCAYNNGEYVKRVVKSSGIYDEFYNSNFYYCGGTPLSSSLVQGENSCYGTQIKTVTRSVLGLTSTSSAVAPAIPTLPTSHTAASAVISFAAAIPTELAAHPNADAYAVKSGNIGVKKATYGGNLIAASFIGGEVEAIPLYYSCKAEGSAFRRSFKVGSNIVNYKCPESSCNIHGGDCTVIDTVPFNTNAPGALSTVGTGAQTYTDANTVIANNIKYTSVLSGYYVNPSAAGSISSVPTGTYVITSTVFPVTEVLITPLYTSGCEDEFDYGMAVAYPNAFCILNDGDGVNSAKINFAGVGEVTATYHHFTSTDYRCGGSTIATDAVGLACSTTTTKVYTTTTLFATAVQAAPTGGYVSTLNDAIDLGNAADWLEDHIAQFTNNDLPFAWTVAEVDGNVLKTDLGYKISYIPGATIGYPIYQECTAKDGYYFYTVQRYSTSTTATLFTYVCNSNSCDIDNNSVCDKVLYEIEISTDVSSLLTAADTFSRGSIYTGQSVGGNTPELTLARFYGTYQYYVPASVKSNIDID